jgi:alpha-tubulin suppressor-like RCC1 family protein
VRFEEVLTMKLKGWILGTFGMCCFVPGCGDSAPAPAAGTCPDDGSALQGDGERLVALAVRSGEVCALADDGAVFCSSLSRVTTPGLFPGVPRATALTPGTFDWCAIEPGGSAVCWSALDTTPKRVPGLCGATALTSELRCAAVKDGSVRCWGGLQEAVFGKASSERPVAVPGVTGAVDVESGANGYACALISDGSVTCWGGGPRLSDRPSILPEPVPEIAGAVALSGSPSYAREMCAILADGGVTCWSHAMAPVPVPSLENAVALAVASSHACAVLADGTVRCWGDNLSGQLGDGTIEARETPVSVEGISNAVAVAVGGSNSFGTSCALLDDGTARCWGTNAGGLDTQEIVNSSTPVVLPFP